MSEYVFKIGDIVKCTDIINSRDLTLNRCYIIVEISENHIRVIDDVGDYTSYSKTRFVFDLVAKRDTIINDILY